MRIASGQYRAMLLATTMITALAAPAGAQQAVDVELETITVEGQAQGAGGAKPKTDPAATEGTGSYTTDRATIGGKGAVPLRQIPQSVSVITRQRIEDQNFTQLEDIARRTVGLHVLRNDPGRSSIFSRGFEFDTALVNGLPAPMASIYGTQPDLFIFDRVEVLRGPAALFSAAGEPGGAVNLVLKRPTEETKVYGSVSGGSWNNFRGEIDTSGSLVKSGAVRGRVAAAFQDRDSFVDVNDNQVGVLFGTVEADLTDDTTLTVSAWRQERKSTPFNGLPAYADRRLLDVDRSTFVGADWNRFDNESNEALVELEHRLDNGGRIGAGMRVTDREVDYLYGFAGSVRGQAAGVDSSGNIPRAGTARRYEERTVSADAHIDTPFQAWGLTHNFVAGVDYRRYEQTVQNGTVTVPGTTNVFDPDPSWQAPVVSYGDRLRTEPEQMGAYSQLRVKPVQPVTVVLGGRLGWYQNQTTNLRTGGLSGEFDEDAKFLPNLGLVVDITDNISVYGSYAESFALQTTAGAESLEPRESDSYEAGVKTSWFNGNLNTQLAVFQQHDKNRAFSDISTGGVFAAVGEVEINGVEAEISGSPIKGWDVFAGYTFSDMEFIRAPVAQNGQAFSSLVPRHVFSLWTQYKFDEGYLKDWSIGGGVKAVSSFYNVNGAARFEEDGYVIVDARLAYDINENIRASATVTNLFDEVYYERLGSATVFNFYGEPRAFNVKLEARF
ncbi:TonB-dependent siderophore receptor [Terrihabitans rhizophilus]|uniref:TonB-dependent siderophore receptor n=1 Tax=Terrihabitans rhizophilus TaxID=3092662 RepID=A0ABU4RQ84_9HYPH|nr:TonB-dependent siderophore receptor [Terrihabitans sp. PJ23]MDX6806987.1 TonB-dependent siderophore receptor [Terrihabitans sp. PJ23]